MPQCAQSDVSEVRNKIGHRTGWILPKRAIVLIYINPEPSSLVNLSTHWQGAKLTCCVTQGFTGLISHF